MYKDRGMQKWQGFMLSEHNEDIKYHNRSKIQSIFLDEQELEMFNVLLQLSMENKTIIKIISSIFNDEYGKIIETIGCVKKYDPIEQKVQLMDIQNNKVNIAIKQIQSIEEFQHGI